MIEATVSNHQIQVWFPIDRSDNISISAELSGQREWAEKDLDNDVERMSIIIVGSVH